MTTGLERGLSAAEQSYSDRVEYELRALPRRIRRSLLEVLRQNLTERPPSGRSGSADRPAPEWLDDVTELEGALGAPADYAAELIADAERASPGSIARARRRHRTWITVAVVAAVALVGAGSGTFHWWLSFDPEFAAPMSRVCASVATAEDCGQAGFVDLYPANMLRVPCTPDTPLYIDVGLTAQHGATITGAIIPGVGGLGNADYSTQMLRLDSVRPWTRPNHSSGTHPAQWPITVRNDAMMPELHFALTTCPTGGDEPKPTPGGGTVLDGIQVRYRALGRDRVATIPFNEPIAVIVPN